MAVLFPPQVRDWGLPGEVPLTPRAARRVAREGSLHSFDQAALALNEDWGTHLDGKQIQRWAEAIGRTVVSARDGEVRAFEQGSRPATPENAPVVLVIGMDGGRVQTRERQGKLTYRDRFAVEALFEASRKRDHRLREMIVLICQSPLFRRLQR